MCQVVDYNYGYVKQGTGFIFQLKPIDKVQGVPDQLFYMIGVVSFQDKTNEQIYQQFPIAYASILEILNVYNIMHVGQLIGRKIKCLIQFDQNNNLILVDKEYVSEIIKN